MSLLAGEGFIRTMLKRNWTDTAFGSISELLESEPGLAAFDFDNTLIYNDLGEACMNYMALQGLIRADSAEFWQALSHPAFPTEQLPALRVAYERALSGAQGADIAFGEAMLHAYLYLAEYIGLETAYRWTRVFFAGHTEEQLRSIARHVFAHEQEQSLGQLTLPGGLEISSGIRIYQEIAELISAMTERGWTVCVVTASPEPLIQAVISSWGLPDERVYGMQLARGSADEPFSPVIVEPLTFAYGKVARLAAEQKGTLLFAAGDSWTDYALLLAARQALLIDRGNDALRERAKLSGFEIQPRFIAPGGVGP